MTLWKRVQGDVDDTITVKLAGIASLAAVQSVEAHVWWRTSHETLAASVADPDECTLTVELGAADGWLSDAAAVQWEVEYQLTFLDGSVKTWPETPDKISVRAQGDPPAP